MNHGYWKNKIEAALDAFVRRLPESMRMPYSPALVARHYLLTEIEDADQLAAISQRESLPVMFLQHFHLMTFNVKEGKLKPITDKQALLEKIARINKDYQGLYSK